LTKFVVKCERSFENMVVRMTQFSSITAQDTIIDEMIIDEMIIDEMIIDEMIIDEMIIDEMIIDEMIIDEMRLCEAVTQQMVHHITTCTA
jgi:hypothetical protein